MKALVLSAALLTAVRPLSAQSEDVLRQYFEGRSVIAKIEMPGTEDGVDLYPERSQRIDFSKHARRLKQYGTAVRRGDELLVTKIKVKKDLIEFQFGGGGYGTFGDESSSDIYIPSASKTTRERNLEKELEKTKDEAQRRKIREELDQLRKEREREDARNRARVAEAEQVKEANIRQRRLESGSRFNIRYEPNVPVQALTPDAVMNALAEYVDFSPMKGSPLADGGRRELRKGLTVAEVDALFGRPVSISTRKEGSLEVNTSVYRDGERSIAAEFVEGVLIRYAIRSE